MHGPYSRTPYSRTWLNQAAGGSGVSVSVTQAGVGIKVSVAIVVINPVGEGQKYVEGGAGAVVSIASYGSGLQSGGGGNKATITVAVGGAGRKKGAGGYNGQVTVAAYGDGIITVKGGAGTAVTVATYGDGGKRFLSGSGTAVTVATYGDGVITILGGDAVPVFVAAYGDGEKVEHIYFIDEPLIRTQGIIATHVWVVSPTAEYLAYIPGTPDENKIEKLVPIEVGNMETCKAIAERLLEKYGREQKSVTGKVDLVVTTKFKEKLRVWIPSANIDEYMVLQSKEHDLDQRTTVLTLGDIMLNEDEWLARILQEI